MNNKGFVEVGSLALLVAIAVGVSVALFTVKFDDVNVSFNSSSAYDNSEIYSPYTPFPTPPPRPCYLWDWIYGRCFPPPPPTPVPQPTCIQTQTNPPRVICYPPYSTPFPSQTPIPLPTRKPPSLGSGIAGVVTIGPTCPVVRPGYDCADQPYQGDFLVKQAGGKQSKVASFSTNAQGSYLVYVPPGNYLIEPSQAFLSRQTFFATVRGNMTTELNFTLDSGIR